MVNIVADQVLYGWAEKKGRSGYQFITQSTSLSEDDFNHIEKYSIPMGLNNITFKEGRRLLTLPSGKIAMNYVKNIGKDIHGRDGALMSHFLVFDFKNFVEARKNLEELDRHHLKGITSVKDIEKLKLANGNFMQLPVVNIEIDVNDQSYGEELISDKKKEFSRDVLYGLFLNIFQEQIKIGVISTDLTSMFRQIMTLESLFPPWLVLSYSTYDAPPSQDEAIFDLVCTLPAIDNSSHVIINYTGKTVEIPGEDSLIRSVSNEYFRLIETGKVYEIGDSSDLPQSSQRTTLANIFISRIIKSICSNAEPSMAINTALKVSKMESYGKKEEYFQIVGDIIRKSGFRDDLIDATVKYLENNVEEEKAKGSDDDLIGNIMPVLIQCDPNTVGGRNLVQFLKNLSSSNYGQINEVLMSNMLKKDSNVNMGRTLFTTIPTLFRTWSKYSTSRKMSSSEIDQSISILKNFDIARKDLFTLVEESIMENRFEDLDFLREVLETVAKNNEVFDQKKMYNLITQVKKGLVKRKILIPPELNSLIVEMIGGEEEPTEKRRFRLRG
ncbi:MAG: hypothetical protein M1323_04855 [Candidatus Thermoplasmatota archaeon]|nr:hypothetical protein [Candidatus Thermoplasmatota archaeon]